ncbi:DnaJ family domain-containing protein [Caldimonas brevitalea]|uniref:Cytoplasmic protein n=1 Tax=Caldimonas brevitalea TaxID=413882 RepID=A0A0G3BQ96_9BURK|nr:DnaJ family domain-containing protein [Caldimonas brevitalea]AKJ28730.1 cytoplasmic protein [Caldimonas brevitalea]
MSMFDRVAEDRILAAIADGKLSGLPGEGRPLALDDDPLVPPEQRALLRVLKNAGEVPEAVRLLKELRELEAQPDADTTASAERLLRVRIALERAGISQGKAALARYGAQLRARQRAR